LHSDWRTLKNAQVSTDALKKAAGGIMPQSGRDLVFFLLLAVTAGIFEEILFRGYLQKQLGALTRNSWIGMVSRRSFSAPRMVTKVARSWCSSRSTECCSGCSRTSEKICAPA